MNRLLLNIIIIGFAVCSACTTGRAQQTFRVLEYNVENFFDCKHDTLKNDYEYLPGSLRGWNWTRFQDKRNKIAKVILAASDEQVPDVVVLCEVENAACMESLTRFSPLKDAAYRYVMTDSPDERGIDVALMYQPATFRLIGKNHIRIPATEGRKPTRDILHVTGRVVSGDTIDFIACHLPSRAGGKQTAPYRWKVARTLRTIADSVQSARSHPHLIILGDFNDTPSSPTLSEALGAQAPASAPAPQTFYNLMLGKPQGTYRYKGSWDMLDQFIVSGRLLCPHHRLYTSASRASILAFPFLLEQDERYGGNTPNRTYKGMKYHGGFSDHLPILLELTIAE